MAVTRTLDRIRDGLEAVFTTRAAPDDRVEFDASFGVLAVHDEEEQNCSSHAVVYIWVALMCPEIAEKARSTCQVTVPITLLDDAEEVAEVGNDLWDALQSHRALTSLETSMGEDDPTV